MPFFKSSPYPPIAYAEFSGHQTGRETIAFPKGENVCDLRELNYTQEIPRSLYGEFGISRRAGG
jgi:hypothetical protein